MPRSPALAAATRLAGRALPLMEEWALAAGADALINAGPVFLPPGGRLPRLHPAQENAPLPPRSSTAAVCCFALTMPLAEDLDAWFLSLARQAGHTLIFDFKMPERNLDYPGVLLFSPLRRRLSCGRRGPAGGLEALLYRHRDQCRVLQRRTLGAGALCLVLVQNRD